MISRILSFKATLSFALLSICLSTFAETGNELITESLCAAFTHSNGTADLEASYGFDQIGTAYLYTDWGSDHPAIGQEGNRCTSLAITHIRAEVWDDPFDQQPSISTDWIEVEKNPFVNPNENAIYTNGTDIIGLTVRDYMGETYAKGPSGCKPFINQYLQGSSLCIKDSTNYQQVIGNINSNRYRDIGWNGYPAAEIWMCRQSTNCHHTYLDNKPNRYVAFYARHVDTENLGSCGPCEPWKNHGDYVRCVANAVEELVEMKLITEDEGDTIISSRARSKIGKKGFTAPQCQ